MHVNESAIGSEIDRGDGVCKHFDESTRLCTIYKKRPIFCNVDMFYNTFLCSKCTREEFYAANYTSCKKLKERYGE